MRIFFAGALVFDAFFLDTVFVGVNPRIAAADAPAIFLPFLVTFFLVGDFFAAAFFLAAFFAVFFVAATII